MRDSVSTTRPNRAAANPAIALWLQSTRPVGRVAELWVVRPLNHAMSKRRLISIAGVATGSIAAAGILLVMLSSGSRDYRPIRTTIHDSSLVVTRFTVTQGTNHTGYRGSPLIGRLNRVLMQFGLGCVGDARQLTKMTPKDSAVLWITYKCPSTLGLAVPGNAALHFTDTQGHTLLVIENHTLMLDPKSNRCLTIWSLPAHLTNYAGCEMHLVTRTDGKKVVSFEL